MTGERRVSDGQSLPPPEKIARNNAMSYEATDKRKADILIVDDEKYICIAISRWLAPEGFNCVMAHDYNQALACMENQEFDLLISDINMPGKSGIELLRTTKERFPRTAILMATAVDERNTAIHALELGAYGYLIKPFDKNEFMINIASALERRRHELRSKEYERQLEQEVRDRTADIRNREEEIALRLVWASEFRDDTTGEHIRRIGMFSAILAEALGHPKSFVDDIRVASPMHDVGKIGVPDHILLKPDKLTPSEFEIIKKHTEFGAGILGGSDIPLLQFASEIALTHHEKWDGSGYPHGLVGEEIPEAARIVAIVDEYDALSFDRVYRHAYPEERVLEILRQGKGTHFEPRIFECFMEILPQLRRVQIKKFTDDDSLQVENIGMQASL
jgi:putative two-component system response regulator